MKTYLFKTLKNKWGKIFVFFFFNLIYISAIHLEIAMPDVPDNTLFIVQTSYYYEGNPLKTEVKLKSRNHKLIFKDDYEKTASIYIYKTNVTPEINFIVDAGNTVKAKIDKNGKWECLTKGLISYYDLYEKFPRQEISISNYKKNYQSVVAFKYDFYKEREVRKKIVKKELDSKRITQTQFEFIEKLIDLKLAFTFTGYASRLSTKDGFYEMEKAFLIDSINLLDKKYSEIQTIYFSSGLKDIAVLAERGYIKLPYNDYQIFTPKLLKYLNYLPEEFQVEYAKYWINLSENKELNYFTQYLIEKLGKDYPLSKSDLGEITIKDLIIDGDSEKVNCNQYEKGIFEIDSNGNFKEIDINSNPKCLAEYFNAKYILVDIWATWCTPCISDMGNFKSQAQFLKENNIKVIFLCINMEESNKENIVSILNQKLDNETPIKLSIEPNNNLEFRKVFHFTTEDDIMVPRKILINSSGKELGDFFTHFGDMEEFQSTISEKLD